MHVLTQEKLKELLDYDPETGIFTWKERTLEMFKRQSECTRFNNKFAGEKATILTKRNYYKINVLKKDYHAIYLAWFYIYGKWPKSCLDYIDNNKTNLKIKNIREATKSDLQRKRNKADKRNETNLIGVVKTKGNLKKKYRARIQIENKTIELGRFETETEAHQAYVEAKRIISPEFCML